MLFEGHLGEAFGGTEAPEDRAATGLYAPVRPTVLRPSPIVPVRVVMPSPALSPVSSPSVVPLQAAPVGGAILDDNVASDIAVSVAAEVDEARRRVGDVRMRRTRDKARAEREKSYAAVRVHVPGGDLPDDTRGSPRSVARLSAQRGGRVEFSSPLAEEEEDPFDPSTWSLGRLSKSAASLAVEIDDWLVRHASVKTRAWFLVYFGELRLYIDRSVSEGSPPGSIMADPTVVRGLEDARARLLGEGSFPEDVDSVLLQVFQWGNLLAYRALMLPPATGNGAGLGSSSQGFHGLSGHSSVGLAYGASTRYGGMYSSERGYLRPGYGRPR